jgi:hypothetical protein
MYKYIKDMYDFFIKMLKIDGITIFVVSIRIIRDGCKLYNYFSINNMIN